MINNDVCVTGETKNNSCIYTLLGGVYFAEIKLCTQKCIDSELSASSTHTPNRPSEEDRESE